MHIFTLEHTRAAQRADFMSYGIAVAALAVLLLVGGPRGQRMDIAACALTGLAAWTLVEYVLHRFVLHGLPPFDRWHAQHHRRPTALIFTPTLASAALIFALVFFPALLAGGMWRACALTLGVMAGYLAYTITHHAVHLWHADNAWLKQRKRWHALHHHCGGQPVCFGVTSGFWDHVFGSIHPGRRAGRSRGESDVH